jgi:hypothetical protein
MWELLHSAGQVYDANSMNIDALVRPLKIILPCRYCRDSFVLFYDELRKPVTGRGLLWTYKVHTLVNEKLARQRLEKSGVTGVPLKDLFSEPTFEVLQKRLLVNSDELFTWKSISVVLLALTMSNADEKELVTFVTALRRAIEVSKQQNTQMIVDFLDVFLKSSDRRHLLDTTKYSNGTHSDLIRAGSCIAGSCF